MHECAQHVNIHRLKTDVSVLRSKQEYIHTNVEKIESILLKVFFMVFAVLFSSIGTLTVLLIQVFMEKG